MLDEINKPSGAGGAGTGIGTGGEDISSPVFRDVLADMEKLKRAEAELMKGYDTELKASIEKTRPEYIDLWRAQANDRHEVQARGLESLIKAEEDNKNRMIELSQRTAEAMEQNFSDFYFDVMMGKYRDLGDYAEAVFRSIVRAQADIMGQQTREALFGTGGGSGLLSSAGSWLGSLFSGGSNYAGAGTRGVNPGDVNWHAKGGSFGPDEWIGVGEKGPGR
jgi:hypothetical protein